MKNQTTNKAEATQTVTLRPSFKVTQGNRKLGSICAINLPAIVTCRENAPCKKGCYATKGTFRYKNVSQCYENNLKAFMMDAKQTEEDILDQLPLRGFCRIHGSGDVVNAEYFLMLISIAKKAKGVKFMMFTKKYEIVNDYISNGGKVPRNLKILLSNWIDWKCENPHNLPTAELYDPKVDNFVSKKLLPCSGKCDQCFSCWDIRKGSGVVFVKH